MIGRDFSNFGRKDGVYRRYKDARINGAIKLKFISSDTLCVFDTTNSVFFVKLNGKITTKLTSTQVKLHDDTSVEEEDESEEANIGLRVAFDSFLAVDICTISPRSTYAIADIHQHCVKVLSTETWTIDKVIGRRGSSLGEFRTISGIDSFTICNEVFLAVVGKKSPTFL